MPIGVSKSVTTTMRFDEDEWAFLERRRKAVQLRRMTGLVRVCLRVASGRAHLKGPRISSQANARVS